MNKKHMIMAGILASGLLISTNTANASMNTGFSPTTSEAKTSVTYKWDAPKSFSYNVKWKYNTQLSFAKLLTIINQVEKPVVIDKENEQQKEETTPIPEVEKPVEPEKKPEVVTPTKPVEEKPVVKEPETPVKENVEKEPAVKEPTTEAKDEVKVTSEIQQVVDLTNKERAKAGLQALQIDTKLTQSAQAKSQDMKNKNYFSHTSPTYGSPFDQMKSMGITYKSAAENIAMGQRSPAEVVDAWMKSPGHKANIMNGSFTHIGVGLSDSGYYWTQQFIGK
ncbi:CAP domain-containing protein [Psychrobacillus psychrodurans]|uniref:CAP domain-containing protein n=1 Tax=Psychrobacillus psychrodurans TaxID=126157 RepID=A0A9X3L7A9_9BACI|nr:CAP domain-containing protein [Psychrobacillus psychrodurans]MCZ8532480.1 CAP domain-containing protein [Psychrobacillus psychrodurans]